jgi:hypothetical protein
MITVDVSGLEGEDKDEVTTFIEARLPVKSEKATGDEIVFEDKDERTHIRSPDLRTYLKKFLHERKLKKRYRLLSEEGVFIFVRKREEEKEDEEEEATSSKK